ETERTESLVDRQNEPFAHVAMARMRLKRVIADRSREGAVAVDVAETDDAREFAGNGDHDEKRRLRGLAHALEKKTVIFGRSCDGHEPAVQLAAAVRRIEIVAFASRARCLEQYSQYRHVTPPV